VKWNCVGIIRSNVEPTRTLAMTASLRVKFWIRNLPITNQDYTYSTPTCDVQPKTGSCRSCMPVYSININGLWCTIKRIAWVRPASSLRMHTAHRQMAAPDGQQVAHAVHNTSHYFNLWLRHAPSHAHASFSWMYKLNSNSIQDQMSRYTFVFRTPVFHFVARFCGRHSQYTGHGIFTLNIQCLKVTS
jgi:hypothetical protein